MKTHKVLIVDDSALIREVLSEVLSSADDIEVVGTAKDAYKAWEKIQRLRPDVVTLDIEMPRMDGLTFLERLMRLQPMPVVMVSKLTQANCEATFRALELGAVDFVAKPTLDIRRGTLLLADELIEKVRAAAIACVTGTRRAAGRPGTTRPADQASCSRSSAPRQLPTNPAGATREGVVAMGASTGGVEALRIIFGQLPADAPGIVVVQHMPAGFTLSFAERLDGLCPVQVSEARDRDEIVPGRVLIAPGERHTEVRRKRGRPIVRVFDGPPVNRHRPSVDVLFESCAETLGREALGVLLTGMGDDGARGLLAMREAGAGTLVQDESTCVVFGMPREAILLGACEHVRPLDEIPRAIQEWSPARVSRT